MTNETVMFSPCCAMQPTLIKQAPFHFLLCHCERGSLPYRFKLALLMVSEKPHYITRLARKTLFIKTNDFWSAQNPTEYARVFACKWTHPRSQRPSHRMKLLHCHIIFTCQVHRFVRLGLKRNQRHMQAETLPISLRTKFCTCCLLNLLPLNDDALRYY